LHHGKVVIDDKTAVAMPYYLKNLDEEGRETTVYDAPRELDHLGQRLRIRNVQLRNAAGEPTTNLTLGECFSVEVEFELHETLNDIAVILGIDTILGTLVTTASSEESAQVFSGQAGDSIHVVIRYDNLVLNTGRYALRIGMRVDKNALDLVRQALIFSVSDIRTEDSLHYQPLFGIVRYTPEWEQYHPQQSWVTTSDKQ
jgi:hypothetical protein